jgi:hypothetical protein
MADVEGYLARVDAHLATLNEPGRRVFIDSLVDQWTQRYERFMARVDRNQPTDPTVSAYDYIDTLAGLDVRAANVTARAA